MVPRQKRKYRCRVRSPATIQRAKRQRRDKANARERRRMNSLNDALEELRQILPHSGQDPKMTKIETLKFAQTYIAHLGQTLQHGLKEETGVDFRLCSEENLQYSSNIGCYRTTSSPFSQHTFLSPTGSSFSTHYTPDVSPQYPGVLQRLGSYNQ